VWIIRLEAIDAARSGLLHGEGSTPPRKESFYLCAIKDTCSNRIVGYSIDSRMARVAVTAAS
jgi:transposase InsO family protein